MGVVSFRLRRVIDGDAPELFRLYADTTREINGKHYTPQQIAQWVQLADDLDGWAERLRANITWVAQGTGGILGFAELEAIGNIGYLYVHRYQGHGIGTALMKQFIRDAGELGLSRVSAEVSTSAMPFFRTSGFVVRKENRRIVCGSEALQYEMEFAL